MDIMYLVFIRILGGVIVGDSRPLPVERFYFPLLKLVLTGPVSCKSSRYIKLGSGDKVAEKEYQYEHEIS